MAVFAIVELRARVTERAASRIHLLKLGCYYVASEERIFDVTVLRPPVTMRARYDWRLQGRNAMRPEVE